MEFVLMIQRKYFAHLEIRKIFNFISIKYIVLEQLITLLKKILKKKM